MSSRMEDWVECKLNDLLILMKNGSSAKQFKENVGLPISRIETISHEKIDFSRVKYIKENDVEFIEKYRLKKNDILLSHINSDSHLGKTAIFKNDSQILIHGINLLLLRPVNQVDANFLLHQFRFKKVKGDFIAVAQRAVNQSSINQRKLKLFDFIIPPLPIQRAIVRKIESLFSSLDSGIADLKKAQEQLKIYRQAVLKKAFEGELTNSEIHEGSDLSQNWRWANIKEFLNDDKSSMRTGPFGTALKKHEHRLEGVPVLGIENIGEGTFKMPNKTFITVEKSKELQSFIVKFGDIIISRSGTVGELCSVPQNMEGSIISTNLIRLRLNLQKVSPSFFVYLFQGGNVREQVKELCKGSTRVFLNQTILKKLNLPFCGLKIQKEVVKEIESRLSVCESVEESINESLEKAQALRQSILKKAFEGKLLTSEEIEQCKQEADYEPASVLLERIKKKRNDGNGVTDRSMVSL